MLWSPKAAGTTVALPTCAMAGVADALKAKKRATAATMAAKKRSFIEIESFPPFLGNPKQPVAVWMFSPSLLSK
jgi:hypothetical protein